MRGCSVGGVWGKELRLAPPGLDCSCPGTRGLDVMNCVRIWVRFLGSKPRLLVDYFSAVHVSYNCHFCLVPGFSYGLSEDDQPKWWPSTRDNCALQAALAALETF